MKTLRYVPQNDEASRVTLSVRATDTTIVVPRDGYSTTCQHEQRALDASAAVKRQAKPAAAKAPTKTKDGDA